MRWRTGSAFFVLLFLGVNGQVGPSYAESPSPSPSPEADSWAPSIPVSPPAFVSARDAIETHGPMRVEADAGPRPFLKGGRKNQERAPEYGGTSLYEDTTGVHGGGAKGSAMQREDSDLTPKEALEKSTEFRSEGEQIIYGLAFFTVCFLLASAVEFTIDFLPVSIRPPVSIAHFATGMLAFIVVVRFRLGVVAETLMAIAEMHPNVIVFILVPILLYSAASCVNWHVFNKIVWSALLLAILGVVFQIFVLGFVIWVFLTDEVGNPFTFAWSAMIASMLSATDPVAVVAVLHELNAPEKLSALIEGESLLNDGSAAVFFILFRNMADRCHFASDPTKYMPDFVRLVLGGPLVGLGLAWTVCSWLRRFRQPSILEVVIVLSFVYVSFWLADILQISGFLAVAAYGVFFAASGRVQLSRQSQVTLKNVVKLLECIASQALFVIAGIASSAFIALGSEFEGSSPRPSSPSSSSGSSQQHHFQLDINDSPPLSHWGALVGLYICMMAARGLMVLSLSPFLIRLGYGFSWKEGTILWWGGLRGALGLALALSVFGDPECFGKQLRRETTFFVYGGTAFTLFINGSTMGLLYKWLKPFPTSEFRRHFLQQVLHSIDERYNETKEHITHHWLFKADAAVLEAADLMVPHLADAQIDDQRILICELPVIHKALRALKRSSDFVEGKMDRLIVHLHHDEHEPAGNNAAKESLTRRNTARWHPGGHRPQRRHDTAASPIPMALPLDAAADATVVLQPVHPVLSHTAVQREGGKAAKEKETESMWLRPGDALKDNEGGERVLGRQKSGGSRSAGLAESEGRHSIREEEEPDDDEEEEEEDGQSDSDAAESEANDIVFETLGCDHIEDLNLGRQALQRLASIDGGHGQGFLNESFYAGSVPSAPTQGRILSESPAMNLTSESAQAAASSGVSAGVPETQLLYETPSPLTRTHTAPSQTQIRPGRPPKPSRQSGPSASAEASGDPEGLGVPLLSNKNAETAAPKPYPSATPLPISASALLPLGGSAVLPVPPQGATVAPVETGGGHSHAHHPNHHQHRRPSSRHMCPVTQKQLGPSPSLFNVQVSAPTHLQDTEAAGSASAAGTSLPNRASPGSSPTARGGAVRSSSSGQQREYRPVLARNEDGVGGGAKREMSSALQSVGEANAVRAEGAAGDVQEFSRVEKEGHLAMILFQCCRQLYQNMYDDESITSGSLIDLQAAVDVAVDQIEAKLAAGVSGIREERQMRQQTLETEESGAYTLQSLSTLQDGHMGTLGASYISRDPQLGSSVYGSSSSSAAPVHLDPFDLEFAVLENRLDALSPAAFWSRGWRDKLVGMLCLPLPSFLANKAKRWSQRRDFGKTLSALEQLIAYASTHDELEDFARDSGVWKLLSKETKKSLKQTTKRVERVAERLYRGNARAYAEVSCLLAGRLLLKAKRKIVVRFVRRGLLEHEEEETLLQELLDVQLRRIRNYTP